MSSIDDRPMMGMAKESRDEESKVHNLLLQDKIYGTDINTTDCYEIEGFRKLFTDKGIAVLRCLPIQQTKDTSKYYKLRDTEDDEAGVSHVVTQQNYVPFFGMGGSKVSFFAGYPAVSGSNLKYSIKLNPYVALSRIINAGKKDNAELELWAGREGKVGYVSPPKQVAAFYALIYRSIDVSFTGGSEIVSPAMYLANDGFPKGLTGKLQIALFPLSAWRKAVKELRQVDNHIDPDSNEVHQKCRYPDPFDINRSVYLYLFNNCVPSSFCKQGGVPNPITGAPVSSDEIGYSIAINQLYYPIPQEVSYLQAKFGSQQNMFVPVQGTQGPLSITHALALNNSLPAEWLAQRGPYLRKHPDVLQAMDNEQTMRLMAEYCPLSVKLCDRLFKGPIRQLLDLPEAREALETCPYEDIFDYERQMAPATYVPSNNHSQGGFSTFNSAGVGNYTNQPSTFTNPQSAQTPDYSGGAATVSGFPVSDLPSFSGSSSTLSAASTPPATSTPSGGPPKDIPVFETGSNLLNGTTGFSATQSGEDDIPFEGAAVAANTVEGLNPDTTLPADVAARIAADRARSLHRS